MIPADIAKDFERYSGTVSTPRLAAVEEAGVLFAKPWADGAAMAANLLSATTGMRQGEVLAVRGEDIGEDVLNVAHSWSAEDGLKSPKKGETRRVPLLPEVREALPAVLAGNPHTDIPEADRFVFWGPAPDKPRYDGVFMPAALHVELEAAGLDWRARNIVFHGWRHFYAARMADIEAADKVSRITGHRSRAVFDAYADHVTEAAVRDMGKAAAVFAGVPAGGGNGAGGRGIGPLGYITNSHLLRESEIVILLLARHCPWPREGACPARPGRPRTSFPPAVPPAVSVGLQVCNSLGRYKLANFPGRPYGL